MVDKMKHKMPLAGSIAAGATLTIPVKKPAELSNKGGIVTLIDERGVKVHGVSYTREQARTPGLTVAFRCDWRRQRSSKMKPFECRTRLAPALQKCTVTSFRLTVGEEIGGHSTLTRRIVKFTALSCFKYDVSLSPINRN